MLLVVLLVLHLLLLVQSTSKNKVVDDNNDSILCKDCSVKSKTKDNDDMLFMEWYVRNGGYIHPALKIDYFPHMGRGFRAERRISEEEKLLYIPSSLIFSMKNLQTHMTINNQLQVLSLLKTIIEVPENILIAWLLIEQRNQTSFFQPYINILPSYIPSPIHFNDYELSELQNTRLVVEVNEMKKGVDEDYHMFLDFYAQLRELVPHYHSYEVSREDYLWSASMFNSRGLRFKGQVW